MVDAWRGGGNIGKPLSGDNHYSPAIIILGHLGDGC
jgi:hypothetical protein